MREIFFEWECMPGSVAGLIESMDAAGLVIAMDVSQGDPGDATVASEADACVFAASCEAPIPRLDLRHLPAPEPLERAMAAADALAPGAKFEALTPMLPIPLLQLLEARGFAAQAELLKDGSARILVERGAD